MSNQKPALEQSAKNTLSGALGTFIRSVMMEMEDMLPARVVSYDDATNRAVLQPLVMMGLEDGTKVSRARVAGVPVFRFGGGGFFIRFPIKPGDFGWIKANDRDVSLIFQRNGEDWPNTERLHSFSDAMFFPDTMRDWVINGSNADALVLQSMDGSVCIALHADKITMDAPTMEVNIPNTTWNGNITGVGNLAFTGGSFTHNGTNVGGDHRHADSGGTGTGGTPI